MRVIRISLYPLLRGITRNTAIFRIDTDCCHVILRVRQKVRALFGRMQRVPGEGRAGREQGGDGLRVGMVREDDAAAVAPVCARAADFGCTPCGFDVTDERRCRGGDDADMRQQAMVFAQGRARVGADGERVLQVARGRRELLPQGAVVAVVLADDLIDAPKGALSQMIETYNQTGSSVLGVETVAPEQTGSYGIVEIADWQNYQRIQSIVEKPKPEEAPSNLAVVGRYILTPRIFELLHNTPRGAGGEIQLTDAIAQLLEYEPVLAHAFDGVRYDCGSKIGYLEATLAFGLKHPETSAAFKALVQQYAEKMQTA